MNKILLIDIENCGRALHQLQHQLNDYAQVYVVYATSNVNFSLDELHDFLPFIQAGRFHLLKMSKAGKDAADFGLAFWAGKLSQQYHAQDVVFDIVSHDHAMCYVSELLQRQGFDVNIKHQLVEHVEDVLWVKLLHTWSKVQNKPTTSEACINAICSWLKVDRLQAAQLLKRLVTEKYFVQSQKVSQVNVKPHLQFLYEYSCYLAKQKSKPATKTALLNSIKNVMKIDKEQTLIDRFNLLCKYCIVNTNDKNNKVQYNTDVICRYVQQEL
ncbi:PIN domain-containing protein [Acinetobacter boissieri]|uniref:PIN-like domain-containing protein n=1 Tax=Acinetobacter boissieri TaxID=1219383 RepID=A0A1G6HVW9_9GAMM|nr:PIN domain-containing protein [Acinetobacter boissieri]SDB98371.1 hypothetical protein SAMN05421733_10771 [Acinetobacter boissieri]